MTKRYLLLLIALTAACGGATPAVEADEASLLPEPEENE